MKNNIFKVLMFSFSFLLLQTSLKAQPGNFTIEASQVFSSFRYKDSEGTADKDYEVKIAGAYSLGYQHKFGNGILLHPEIGMRNAGATLVYDDINYSWDLQYADIKLGAGYMYNLFKSKPKIK